MADSPRQDGLVKAATGLIAGIVATGPMTAAMILWHRRLPLDQRYPLPPREITGKIAEKAGVREELSESGESAATLLSHFWIRLRCGTALCFLDWQCGVAGRLERNPVRTGGLDGKLPWLFAGCGHSKAGHATSCRAQFPDDRRTRDLGSRARVFRAAHRGRDHTCRNSTAGGSPRAPQGCETSATGCQNFLHARQ